MRPIHFEGFTHRFGKPKGWDTARDGVCIELSVQVTEAGEHISVWKPTADELKRLGEGGCVVLQIIGVQPPVMLSVQQVTELPPPSAERGQGQ